MLERPSAWPHFRHLREDPSALEAALREFSRAQGGPEKRMPLIAELEAAGREDLIQVVHAAGVSFFLHILAGGILLASLLSQRRAFVHRRIPCGSSSAGLAHAEEAEALLYRLAGGC